jgi:hypothetical protein
LTDDKDIFKDKELLIKIWENERYSRNFAVKLMWENMKYFGTIIAALLGLYSTLLGHFFTATNTNGWFNLLFLVPIPVIVIILSLFARNDLIQRRRRFHLVVTHLLKIEDLLGLHDDLSGRLKHFMDDKSLFTHYNKDLLKAKSTDEYIETEMRKKENTFNSMQQIYILMIIIAATLLTFGLILFVQHLLVLQQNIK